MSPDASSPHPNVPLPVAASRKVDTRFGAESRLTEILVHCDLSPLGSIDELVPDVRPHRNEVLLVDIVCANTASDIDSAFLLGGTEDKAPPKGVFKPLSGENQKIKEHLGLDFLCFNEVFAYLVSQHFHLEIVPPTVLHHLSDGTLGSLQLFLEPEHWQSQSRVFPEIEDEEYDALMASTDWHAMALLDFLLLHPDRHEENLFVERPTIPAVPRLAAIDNGNSLSVYNYNFCKLHGPTLALTHIPGDPQERPRAVPIPALLLQKLADGVQNKDFFLASLSQELSAMLSPEVLALLLALFWARAEALVQHGFILSRHNLQSVTGSTTLSGKHPEIRKL